MAREAFILGFHEIGIDDLPRVGGKNAGLGELIRALGSKGIPVPDGFAITAEAYRHFLRSAGLEEALAEILKGLDPADAGALRHAGHECRRRVLEAEFPADLDAAIRGAYGRLSEGQPGGLDTAVRSSATAEDLPEASFAGQQETFLHVRGDLALLDAVKRCFASLFTDRAISYRHHHGFDASQTALSVGVQRMVRSDLGCAGVMFTLDTETGFEDIVLINATYGLGETLVQGAVNPDEYLVFKPTLMAGHRPIVRKMLGSKEFMMVYEEGGTRTTRTVPVPAKERTRFALGDEDILRLARWACMVEAHFSAKHGRPTPMDLEWAKDGLTDELFILQARPETVESRKSGLALETYLLEGKGTVLTTGRGVGQKIAHGTAQVVLDVKDMVRFHPGSVLVTERTDPDWEPYLERAAAIVTDRGGRTCHAAIVSRELGLPAVVGTTTGTTSVVDGQPITVCCAEGDTGKVYEGTLPFSVQRVDLAHVPRPQRTRVMLNLADPGEALRLSRLPNDGVGLARMEFIINHAIQAHPRALLEWKRLSDPQLKRKLQELTEGYPDPASYFVDRLAQAVGLIAAAFFPKDVIVRFSDFKTNEYANLLGGKAYEPVEENPMLGFRGASRYYDPRYREGFGLECQAMLRVREEMGLRNVKLMVPFCRTPEEGRLVLGEMATHGLRQGRDGLEVYVMCEIPSNVIRAHEFAEIFDGFSIGSNDLTQLCLGVDRDSEVVAHLFDERDPTVKWMISRVIRAAKAHGRKIGLCGQAPSDYPDFAKFLVEAGIDSISLNPDALLRTTLVVLEAEKGVAPVAHPLPALV
ncbi:MAG TPA: phosphoenolpyruvate synthase [Holophagaceae bacterium]|nr:phosphoenolpyruvate synthase [Holophagaceae bacterium]